MTRYDLLKMNQSVIQIFINNKIDLKDVERIAIFEEYTDMRNRGEKYGYVIHHLAEKYGCSPRSILNIATRMTSNIDI